MIGGADQSRKADLELVADIEKQAVLLLWPQVIYCGLDTGISTITSKGQVSAVSPGGSEAVQMSVNVVDVEESDIEGLVVVVAVAITATFGLEDVDLDIVVANDYGGEGGG